MGVLLLLAVAVPPEIGGTAASHGHESRTSSSANCRARSAPELFRARRPVTESYCPGAPASQGHKQPLDEPGATADS